MHSSKQKATSICKRARSDLQYLLFANTLLCVQDTQANMLRPRGAKRPRARRPQAGETGRTSLPSCESNDTLSPGGVTLVTNSLWPRAREWPAATLKAESELQAPAAVPAASGPAFKRIHAPR